MAALNIDVEKANEVLDIIMRVTNSEVHESIVAQAALVRENEADNAMKTSLRDNCKKLQTVYNDSFIPMAKAWLKECSKFEELKAAVDRASQQIQEVRNITEEMNVNEMEVPEM